MTPTPEQWDEYRKIVKGIVSSTTFADEPDEEDINWGAEYLCNRFDDLLRTQSSQLLSEVEAIIGENEEAEFGSSSQLDMEEARNNLRDQQKDRLSLLRSKWEGKGK